MVKTISRFLAVLIAISALGIAGCGDDSGGNNSDNPWEDIDCTGSGDACDQAVCSMKTSYDQALTQCGSYCDAWRECYTTFINCFKDACPSIENFDQTAYQTCVTNVSTCSTAIGQ